MLLVSKGCCLHASYFLQLKDIAGRLLFYARGCILFVYERRSTDGRARFRSADFVTVMGHLLDSSRSFLSKRR